MYEEECCASDLLPAQNGTTIGIGLASADNSLGSMETDPTLSQCQRSQHRRNFVVPILLIFIEVYCMFPFERKGDFAEIGTFVINGIGSLVFLVRCLIVVPFIATRWLKRGLLGTGSVILLIATYFTPLLVSLRQISMN